MCMPGHMGRGLGMGRVRPRPPTTMWDIFGSQILGHYKYYDPACVLNYQDGAGEQIIDGDMELGGIANYTPLAGVNVTKDSTLPYEGTQCLRLTSTGAGTLGCYQTCMVMGARYLIVGRYRSDGTATPTMRDRAGLSIAIGAASTSWQYFSGEFTATHAGLRPSGVFTGAGQWVEFDVLAMIELPGLVTVPNDPVLAARNIKLYSDPFHANQATPLNQPWQHPTIWGGSLSAGQFDGTNHWMQVDAMAARFSGSDKPWFWLSAQKWLNPGPHQRLFSMGNSADATPVVGIRSTTRYVARRTANDTTSLEAASAVNTPTVRHIYAARFKGTEYDSWRNGVPDMVAAPLDVPTMTVDQVTVGARRRTTIDNWFEGPIREILIGTGPVTAAQMIAASQMVAASNP